MTQHQTQRQEPAERQDQQPAEKSVIRKRWLRWWRRGLAVLYPLTGLLAALVLWFGVTYLIEIPKYILPTPVEVLRSFGASYGPLVRHLTFTAEETFFGFVCAGVLGIAAGGVMEASGALRRMIYPLLVASQAVPKVALAPMIAVWLGFGLSSKVALSFVLAVFPIIINTAAGFESVPRELLLLTKATGASRFRAFYSVRIPCALGQIFAGLKLASALSVIGAVVGEFVAADKGLGYFLQTAAGTLSIDLVFASLILLSLLGIVLFLLVSAVEYVAMPWRRVA